MLLVLPVISISFSAFQVYSFQNGLMHNNYSLGFVLQVASQGLSYIIFLGIALYLNVKRKYYENSIMCGTLLLAFVLSLIIHYGSMFASLWLK